MFNKNSAKSYKTQIPHEKIWVLLFIHFRIYASIYDFQPSKTSNKIGSISLF